MTGSDATGTDPNGSDASADGHGGATRDERTSDRAGTALERVRADPRPHAVAVVVAVALGLALSWLHWIGLVLGGAFVALVAPTVRRGVAGAIGFGAIVLVVFALSLGSSVGAVLEMTPIVYLTVVSALGLPLLGSLLRGIV